MRDYQFHGSSEENIGRKMVTPGDAAEADCAGQAVRDKGKPTMVAVAVNGDTRRILHLIPREKSRGAAETQCILLQFATPASLRTASMSAAQLCAHESNGLVGG
jgi:hypothetical protein